LSFATLRGSELYSCRPYAFGDTRQWRMRCLQSAENQRARPQSLA
jgi:hypothetical protein